MAGGASAALAGLIFVAVSLNHEHVLRHTVLPALAAQTLSILIGLVLLCVIGLTPGQSRVLLGSEILVVGIALTSAVLISVFRSHSAEQKLRWHLSRVSLGAVATIPAVIAGASLVVEAGGGLYWLTLEIVAGLVVATYYAWILLIEIRR
ncbi:hypothetical protein [Micromonospora sp. 067-2]|uniref:hypothetical protein n=1 Tax=Micromonospora sp. 067-2 TaxID=2789270 RepID=UPI00397D4E84